MRVIALAAVATLGMTAVHAQQAGAQQAGAQQAGNAKASVMGRWWTPDHDGVVDIEPCASGLCGRVVGITKVPSDGRPLVDVHGRPRCQLSIINDGVPANDGSWDGHITNPDDGKTYTITLRVDPAGQLHMRGYIGIPLFGRTVIWTHFAGRTTPDCRVE